MRQLAMALLILASSHAWAVNKCTGADGRTIFQDMPCAGNGGEITVNPAAGKINPAAAQAARSRVPAPGSRAAQEAADRLEALKKTPSAKATHARQCPSSIEIKNMETSANSITLNKTAQLERWRQIREAKSCRY